MQKTELSENNNISNHFIQKRSYNSKNSVTKANIIEIKNVNLDFNNKSQVVNIIHSKCKVDFFLPNKLDFKIKDKLFGKNHINIRYHCSKRTQAKCKRIINVKFIQKICSIFISENAIKKCSH